MPEGDTLHRIATTLDRALAGRVLTRFESRTATLSVAAENVGLVGRTIDSVRAVGKHCLICFSGGLVLRTHLRMNGSWHVYRPEDRWKMPGFRAQLVLRTSDTVAVGFGIPVAEIVRGEDLRRGPVGRLGPDLLDPEFSDEEGLASLSAHPHRPIGGVLLDQEVLAGVGNVFKSEILFEARVHPDTLIGRLEDFTLRRILEVAKRQLRANTRDGPALRRGRNTTGSLGRGAALFVYGRAGSPCRLCGTAIVLLRGGARVTYVCPRCQPVA